MKYLKRFENTNKPKIGDYVVVHTNFIKAEANDFFMNNPGKITNISKRINPIKEFINVVYDVSKINVNVDRYFKYSEVYGYTINFDLEDVEYFSENHEDAEAYIQSKKYNL